MAPEPKPGDQEPQPKQASATASAADAAGAAGRATQATAARTAGDEAPSAADAAIRRMQGLGGDSAEPAFSGRLVDDVLRRIRDEGLLTAQTVYSTNIYDARIEGSLSVGKTRVKAEPARHIQRVNKEALIQVKDVFEAPAGIIDAASVLRERRMLILRGTPGSGRQTAAMWLIATTGLTDRVFYLRPDRMLAAVHDGQLARDAAYIVPGLDSYAAAHLDQFVLGEIDVWLGKGSMLIITMDSSVMLHPDLATRNDVLVDGIGCPDPIAVAEKHARLELTMRHPASGGEAAEPAEVIGRLLGWLADSEIAARLVARPQPRFAAQVGRALARTAIDNDDARAAIAVLEDPQEHVRQWFDVHTDAAERCLLVAVAALGGASYLAVADAAAALQRQMTGMRNPRHECQSFWPLIADEPWLELTEDRYLSPLGTMPVEVVRFRNGRIQTAVLEYAWRRLDGMRRAMTPWLIELGGAQAAEVKARSAATAGIVSLFDFRYALDNVLFAWAASPAAAPREAAALALSFPAGDSRYRDPVWRLLLSWYDGETAASGEFTETAIRALGGPLGANEPEAALTALRSIAKMHEWEYVFDISESLIQLTASGHNAAVLAALRSWSEQPAGPDSKNELPVIALCCFLRCAMPLAVGAGGQARPVILGSGTSALPQVALLWSRALDDNSLRAWALDLLRGWLDLREDPGDDGNYAQALVLHIAGQTERHRQRLAHHCYKWAKDPVNPSRAATETLALLREQGAGRMETS